MISADEIITKMLQLENKEQREVLTRFFKTDKGEYGEGDMFLGIKVPQTRQIVKWARLSVSLDEIAKLLNNKWHEIRLCGFLLLVEEMKPHRQLRPRQSRELAQHQDTIAEFYLQNATKANNWDLVDLSCPSIIGTWLLSGLKGTVIGYETIDKLASSTNLWEQRIAIVSTYTLIREHRYDVTLHLATKLLSHPHPLIHKAIGWMLREVGKRDISTLRQYLTEHYSKMPRTSLRYAIERMSPEERSYWINRI